MTRIDWRNNSIRLVSLLLAFVLWVYVSNEQNPVRETVININLEHTGLGYNYLITGGMPESVKVRVQGNRSQLANLVPAEFKALVNIPEGQTGDLPLAVQVTAPAGLRVAQVTPDEVRLSVDRFAEKQLTVAVSLRGAPAQGYTALAPVYQPMTVLAKGPSKVISQLNQATAIMDVQAATKDVDQTLQLSVGLAGVTLNPPSVRVMAPIVASVTTKTVPVLIQVDGSPASGFTVKGSSSEPSSVQLSGTVEALAVLTNIKTEDVDIQGVDKDISREVDLVIPQGVSVQPGRVKVQVEVIKDGTTPVPPDDGDGDTSP